MKRFVITHDAHVIYNSFRKETIQEGIESSRLLDFDYVVDGQIIFTTFDKSEADAEFEKYHCDCTFTKTMGDYYEAEIDYYEMSIEEGEIDENGEFEIDDILEVRIAPFYNDIYKK